MANIVQRTQYYPFGLPFADAQGRNLQPYTYNGKENDSRLQLNLMDYEARLYNSLYAGWPTMDPLLEKYYSWSPYVYVANNPLKYIDPDGREKINAYRSTDAAGIRLVGKFVDDYAIHIFAHSTPNHITVRNVNGGQGATIKDADGLRNYLQAKSETWQDRDPGESLTIILHTCRTGMEDEDGNSFAKMISESEYFEDHTIIAPSLYYSLTDDEGTGPFRYGVYDKPTAANAPRNSVNLNSVGVWNVYKKGKKTHTYPGNQQLPKVDNPRFNSAEAALLYHLMKIASEIEKWMSNRFRESTPNQ